MADLHESDFYTVHPAFASALAYTTCSTSKPIKISEARMANPEKPHALNGYLHGQLVLLKERIGDHDIAAEATVSWGIKWDDCLRDCFV